MPQAAPPLSAASRPTCVRGAICALLFFGVTVNYIDRSANLYSVISDVMPRGVVSTIVGFGAAAAGLATLGAAQAVGLALQRTGSYATILGVASTAYVISLAVLQALVPRIGVTGASEPLP